jgi:hypothetical protein
LLLLYIGEFSGTLYYYQNLFQSDQIHLNKMLSLQQNWFIALRCPKHPENIVSNFDPSNDVQPALCETCSENYESKTRLIPSGIIRDQLILSDLLKFSREEGSSDPDTIRRNIENHFDSLKSYMNSAIEETKQSVLARIGREYPRKNGWMTLYKDLEEKYKKVNEGNYTLLSSEFKDFLRTYDDVSKTIERKPKDPNIRMTIQTDEFDALKRGLREKLDFSRERLLRTDKLVSVVNVGPTIKPVNNRINLGKIEKVTIMKCGFEKGLSATALCYMEGTGNMAIAT